MTCRTFLLSITRPLCALMRSYHVANKAEHKVRKNHKRIHTIVPWGNPSKAFRAGLMSWPGLDILVASSHLLNLHNADPSFPMNAVRW